MRENQSDLLYASARAWSLLTNYRYRITYGYKKRLYEITILFQPEDFPHLAGFQYLTDVTIPRYNRKQTLNRVLDGTITFEQIKKSSFYESMVRPRLSALCNLKDNLECSISLYSFMPRFLPFTTTIKADYLLVGNTDTESYTFIIRDTLTESEHICCSVFTKGERDYTVNQRERTILKVERVECFSETTTILYNRITKPTRIETSTCGLDFKL